ncbi:DUF1307 domain-containing protein [Helcococcus bovis]|uniref:DUF1307 domain-containing protein n=1 Tax=Helcococcus bovis TaxID=3153252 RepID=UPI0038B93352
MKIKIKNLFVISLSMIMFLTIVACSKKTIKNVNDNADAVASYEQNESKSQIKYFKNGDKVSRIIHTNILKLEKIDSKNLENIEKIAKKIDENQKNIKGLKYKFSKDDKEIKEILDLDLSSKENIKSLIDNQLLPSEASEEKNINLDNILNKLKENGWKIEKK